MAEEAEVDARLAREVADDASKIELPKLRDEKKGK